MQALIYGLFAALAWGVHDLCVRYVSQRSGILPAMLTVLLTGAVLVSAVAFVWGDWSGLTLPAGLLAATSGAVFAGGTYALYRAFAIGPVKLVAPLIGAYPMLSVAMAMMSGRQVSAAQWAAVLLVVAGVAMIALFSAEDDKSRARLPAVLWGVVAAIGFAATFAIGQAATQAGAGLPVLVLSRAAAIVTVAALMLASRTSARLPLRLLPFLAVMGALDALALGLVLLSGSLPRPELAAVSSSLFGLVTVVLAWAVLRENMTRNQWLSVALTFGGIAWLGF
jgi:drug/metabolite transporter (DMT)-like permease